jgi:hypothetical protein
MDTDALKLPLRPKIASSVVSEDLAQSRGGVPFALPLRHPLPG